MCIEVDIEALYENQKSPYALLLFRQLCQQRRSRQGIRNTKGKGLHIQ